MAGILELINQLEEEQNYEDALEYLQIASDEQLGSYDIKKDTGRILNKLGQYDEALDCFNLVLAMDESNQESLFGKGIACIALNRFDDALDSFNKLIVLDKLNANAWYYKSILSKALGDENAKFYFRRFMKADNEHFRFIRSFYHFGLLFDEIEYGFRQNRNMDVISEVKEQIKSLNLDDEEYLKIIRTVPLENLFDKIIELKGLKSEKDEKDVIRKVLLEQGLSDSDVDDMFLMYDDIEELKNEVIQLCDENPFKGEAKFVPIKIASRYNIIKSVKRLKSRKLYLYNRGNYYYDQKDFRNAVECYDECLKYNKDNKKFEFVKFCANYNLGDVNDE